jgi:hypothetical protein
MALTARTTSTLSRHLQAVGSMLGSSGSRQVFRVEFPPGYSAGDLVPEAGGGFRGFVQSAGEHRIGGQVRLLPAHPRVRPAVLGPLASTPLTISAWDAGVLPHLITDRAVENARMQAFLAGLAAAVSGTIEPVGWMGFDVELTDGEVRILEPA